MSLGTGATGLGTCADPTCWVRSREVQAGEESQARRFAAQYLRGRGGGQDRGGGGGVGSSTTLPKSYRGNLSPGPPRILSLSIGGTGSRGQSRSALGTLAGCPGEAERGHCSASPRSLTRPALPGPPPALVPGGA